jgi:hypothetical protein
MKILFSILLLTLFSAFSFAQQKTQETESVVVAGEGWGIVSLKAKRKAVEIKLGEGINRSQYDDVYFVDYPKKGIQISFNNKNDEANTIFFYNNQEHYESFITPDVKTDKGISWKSKPEDILKAYGKPKNDFESESGKDTWQRLVYDGIDFLFEFGELKRIGILTVE